MNTEASGRRGPFRMAKRWRVGGIVLVVLAILVFAGIRLLGGSTSSEKLAEGVYLIHSSSVLFPDGSNSLAVKTRAGVLLIDTQLPNWTPRVKSAVQELFGRPVALAVNTHWHSDHSGGNDQLSETAQILAHENVRLLLSRPHEGFGLTGPGSHHVYDGRLERGLPGQVYQDHRDLGERADGSSIEAVHYPGAHTDGDTVVYMGNGSIAAVGDIVWPGSFPFVDHHNGGSAAGIVAAIDDILSRTGSQSIIVAGHRKPITHGELFRYRDMVRETIAVVARAMNSGTDLEAIISEGLPEKYAGYASSVVPEATWITMIYQSLAPPAPQ